MIIFDLDGTLADCEHRRHFIEAPEDYCTSCMVYLFKPESQKDPLFRCSCGRQPGLWECDKQAFYEACDKDKPIMQTMQVLRSLWAYSEFNVIEIWTGRCESVREKTEKWLQEHGCAVGRVKMRPIGNFVPEEILKEKWLQEVIEEENFVEMAFDQQQKSVRMWRRKGVFVFNCLQDDEEF